LTRPFPEFIAPEDRAKVEERIKEIKHPRGSAVLERVRLLHREVPKVTLATLSISSIVYHGSPAYMGTLHDVTAKESAEMALGEANRKLQLMTGITRHDIMNQIMVLRGNMVLAKGAKDPASAAVLESRALDAAANIENMIAFTKDYQEIGMNAPTWQNVHSLVSKSVARFAYSGLDMKVDMPKVEILADPLIVKVFHNLIDNAMRHGKSTTRMEFSARFDDGSMLIIVQDNGVGVTSRDKVRIFNRGFGNNTGMGLFFTKDVLSITGITIDEVGGPGQGAKFVLTVPSGKWRHSN
jgi:signal transduction histidine kinase